MTFRLPRVLLVATSAAVAVLAVACMALSHHAESSGRPAVAGPAAVAGSVPNGHDGPASHHGPVDECATTDLLACVRPSIGMAAALALLVVTGFTLLLHGSADGSLWGNRALRRRSSIDGPCPRPGPAPSLLLLCISQT